MFGFWPKAFTRSTATWHQPPGAARDPARLLYHGRVDRRKGALDFLQALALLDRGSFAATISGIGPDLDAAKALAAELGLDATAIDALRADGIVA